MSEFAAVAAVANLCPGIASGDFDFVPVEVGNDLEGRRVADADRARLCAVNAPVGFTDGNFDDGD